MSGRYSKKQIRRAGDALAAGSLLSKERLKALDNQLKVYSTLCEAINSMQVIHEIDTNLSRSDSCLITVKVDEQQISLEVFASDREKDAANKYTKLESDEQEGLIYLLARAGSLEDLRRAYPNYYSDISEFVSWLKNNI